MNQKYECCYAASNSFWNRYIKLGEEEGRYIAKRHSKEGYTFQRSRYKIEDDWFTYIYCDFNCGQLE